jgi:hypothetical protein
MVSAAKLYPPDAGSKRLTINPFNLIVTVEMYNLLNFIYINTILININIQPLRGWGPSSALPQVAPGAIQIQPLWG